MRMPTPASKVLYTLTTTSRVPDRPAKPPPETHLGARRDRSVSVLRRFLFIVADLDG